MIILILVCPYLQTECYRLHNTESWRPDVLGHPDVCGVGCHQGHTGSGCTGVGPEKPTWPELWPLVWSCVVVILVVNYLPLSLSHVTPTTSRRSHHSRSCTFPFTDLLHSYSHSSANLWDAMEMFLDQYELKVRRHRFGLVCSGGWMFWIWKTGNKSWCMSEYLSWHIFHPLDK